MEEQKARFAKLSWWLLEHKYRYYILCAPIIEDYEFDELEREYRFLADLLDLEPTASDMVGFDETRPSSWAVIEKVHNRPAMIDKYQYVALEDL